MPGGDTRRQAVQDVDAAVAVRQQDGVPAAPFQFAGRQGEGATRKAVDLGEHRELADGNVLAVAFAAADLPDSRCRRESKIYSKRDSGFGVDIRRYWLSGRDLLGRFL